MKIQMIAFLAFLTGCASFFPHVAVLGLGAPAGETLSDAEHVLGPRKGGFECYGKNNEPIQVIGFSYTDDFDLLLYFYQGRFIQASTGKAGDVVPPVRADFRDIDNRKKGPDAYEIRKKGKVTIHTLTKKRSK
ncbi:MAG: hypothetical protein IPP68_08630 [Elusimicrobia bacterium]|nr:hypothetical protein [Elusimicrobiota bacterium]